MENAAVAGALNSGVGLKKLPLEDVGSLGEPNLEDVGSLWEPNLENGGSLWEQTLRDVGTAQWSMSSDRLFF